MKNTMTKAEMVKVIQKRIKSAKPAVRSSVTTKSLMNMPKAELTRWYKKARVVKSTIKGVEYKGDIAIR